MFCTSGTCGEHIRNLGGEGLKAEIQGRRGYVCSQFGQDPAQWTIGFLPILFVTTCSSTHLNTFFTLSISREADIFPNLRAITFVVGDIAPPDSGSAKSLRLKISRIHRAELISTSDSRKVISMDVIIDITWIRALLVLNYWRVMDEAMHNPSWMW